MLCRGGGGAMTIPNIHLMGATGVVELLTRAAEILRGDPKRRGCCVHLGNTGRLLVTGDLHDNPIHFAKVLQFAQLENPANHLILQELIHGDRLTQGADMSWRMLAKAAKLIEQYPNQVHLMLANHELAQAFDQPVSKGAGENTALFREGLNWNFGEDALLVDAAIRIFVRALPLAVQTQNGMLCSHSLPSVFDMKNFDMHILERDLREDDYQVHVGGAWQMTWGRNHKPEQVAELAAHWGVKVFVAGHATVSDGAIAAGPQLLLINSDHERGAVLPVQLCSEITTAQELAYLVVPLNSIEVSHDD